MTRFGSYMPGPAAGATVQKSDGPSTLVVVRELGHPPEKVWRALTEPEHLREWAPFDADRNLGSLGTAKLTTVGAPAQHVSETQVTRADPPKTLEFSWGGQLLRWELEPTDRGTRLTLWHNIAPNFVAMGAAGWHICLDVLGQALEGHPIGRIVGADAMAFEGWQRLNAEYSKEFGIAPFNPNWSAAAKE